MLVKCPHHHGLIACEFLNFLGKFAENMKHTIEAFLTHTLFSAQQTASCILGSKSNPALSSLGERWRLLYFPSCQVSWLDEFALSKSLSFPFTDSDSYVTCRI